MLWAVHSHVLHFEGTADCAIRFANTDATFLEALTSFLPVKTDPETKKKTFSKNEELNLYYI